MNEPGSMPPSPPTPQASPTKPKSKPVLRTCMRCGYDLRGSMEAEHCPECGWSVPASSCDWFLKDGQEFWIRLKTRVPLPKFCIRTGEPVEGPGEPANFGDFNLWLGAGLLFFGCVVPKLLVVFVLVVVILASRGQVCMVTYNVTPAVQRRWEWLRNGSGALLFLGFFVWLGGILALMAKAVTPLGFVLLNYGGMAMGIAGIAGLIIWWGPGLRSDQVMFGQFRRVRGLDPRFIQAVRGIVTPPHPVNIGADGGKWLVAVPLPANK